MILMSDRCAEEGQDAVALAPVHGTLVAVDCLNHAVEHRSEELLCSLGVAVKKDLHRVLDIGEQNGDLFALALDAGPCAQDLIGQVLRGIAPGRDKAGIVPNRLYGMATFGTELGGCWHRASTALASSRQRSSTLIAELCVNSVLVRAAWTFHCEPSRAEYAISVALRTIGNKPNVPVRDHHGLTHRGNSLSDHLVGDLVLDVGALRPIAGISGTTQKHCYRLPRVIAFIVPGPNPCEVRA